MKNKKYIIKIFLSYFVLKLVLFTGPVNAYEAMDKFEPKSWSKGLHLFAGLGPNVTGYQSNSDQISEDWLALGSSFTADVGWYFSDNWALETSEIIKFNRTKSYLIWDSIFTIGIRYRFEDGLLGFTGFYSRFFAGYSATTAYPEEHHDEPEHIDRIFFEGPVFGFGLGRLLITESGVNWFLALSLTGQYIGKENEIVMNNKVPVVVSSSTITDQIYSVYLTGGILLF